MPEGEWKFYSDNEKLNQVGSFIQGKQTGEWKGYDETTGQLIYEGSFVAGEKSGLWKVYDKNGKLTTEKTFN